MWNGVHDFVWSAQFGDIYLHGGDGWLGFGSSSYDTWLRFAFPLLIGLFLLYAVLLTIGTFMPGPIF